MTRRGLMIRSKKAIFLVVPAICNISLQTWESNPKFVVFGLFCWFWDEGNWMRLTLKMIWMGSHAGALAPFLGGNNPTFHPHMKPQDSLWRSLNYFLTGDEVGSEVVIICPKYAEFETAYLKHSLKLNSKPPLKTMLEKGPEKKRSIVFQFRFYY